MSVDLLQEPVVATLRVRRERGYHREGVLFGRFIQGFVKCGFDGDDHWGLSIRIRGEVHGCAIDD